MNRLAQLKNKINSGNSNTDLVRTLYMVMQKVGGYSELTKLSLPALHQIIKCIEWEAKEQEKASRRKK